jgi:hypothetical protein
MRGWRGRGDENASQRAGRDRVHFDAHGVLLVGRLNRES